MDADTQREIIFSNHFYSIGPVIMYYDHLLTLPDEIKYIWSQPQSLGSIWFFANRYFNFLGNLILILAMRYMPHTERACNIYSIVRQADLVITQSLIIVLLIIRTYALYGRSRRILFFLITVCICVLGSTMWVFAGQNVSTFISGSRCLRPVSQKYAARIALPWWANFALDALVFGLTIHRTWGTVRASGKLREHNLVYILCRDGALNFGVMGLAYLVSLMTWYFFPAVTKGSLAGATSAIAVSMASRLLLNLRRFSEHVAERPLATIPMTRPGARANATANPNAAAPNLTHARTIEKDAEDEAVGVQWLVREVPRKFGGRGQGKEVWEMNELGRQV